MATKEEWAFLMADVDHAAYDGSASRGGRSATLPYRAWWGEGNNQRAPMIRVAPVTSRWRNETSRSGLDFMILSNHRMRFGRP